MIGQLQQSSSWTGRIVVVGLALLASQLHQSGAPERALAAGGVTLVIGSVIGIAILAIVVARLFGRNIGLIRSDRAAMFTVLFMVGVKIAIARILMPA